MCQRRAKRSTYLSPALPRRTNPIRSRGTELLLIVHRRLRGRLCRRAGKAHSAPARQAEVRAVDSREVEDRLGIGRRGASR